MSGAAADDTLARLLGECDGLSALTAEAMDADLARSVPACPGWSLGELVRHVGSIHRLVGDWVAHGNRPTSWRRQPAHGEGLVAWQQSATRRMFDVLAGADPDATCSTWSPTQRTSAFWRRRMLHETAVHRVDVAQALRRPWSLDEEVALDGIDEAITLWLGTRLGTQVGGTGRRVRLTAVHSGRRECDWVLRALPDMVEYADGGLGVPVDAWVSTDVRMLWSWMWGRGVLPPDALTGDAAAVVELRDVLARSQR